MTASLLDYRASGVNARSCNTGTADAVEGAVRQIIELDCEASAAVDDYVRVDITTPGKVLVATDNTVPRPVIGLIREKLSPTRCNVAVSGVFDDPDSTTQGNVYLSATGRGTSTAPTAGYLQKLGYSFGNGEFDLKPEKNLTNLT